jgi:hypothetical protein
LVAGKAFFSFLLATARCFSFLVMTVAFFFNPGGAARMAFFLKAGFFSNHGGGLTSSFTAVKDEERRANLLVFSSLWLCRLSGLVIFNDSGWPGRREEWRRLRARRGRQERSGETRGWSECE